MRAVSRGCLIGVLIAAACGSSPEEGDDGTGSSGGFGSMPATPGGTDGPTLPTDGGTGGGDTLKFDVGAPMESGTSGGDEACKRVDVIIAIDNSSSMQEEIAALAGPVFDSFPEALLDVGNGLEDFQIGVIDACNNPPFLHDTGAGGACGYTTGTNYMSSTSPVLLAEYACVTQLTQSGYMGQADQCSGDNDDEQPANTAADAVSAPAADAQNAGFVRDDAVLFVVAITDEDEQPVPLRTPQEIYDRIVAAKGTVNNVVFLGIGGNTGCDGPYGSANEAAVLRDVSNLFVAAGRGVFWDLCQGNLEQAFQAGLQVVDQACLDFEPPL